MEKSSKQAPKDKSYNVVFSYTEQTGGYCGVRTWSSFKSKEDFNNWYAPEIRAKKMILKEDVTDEEAIEICLQAPLSRWLAAAKEEATRPDGTINEHILEMGEQRAIFAEELAMEHRVRRSQN
jgi:hypothetical protein